MHYIITEKATTAKRIASILLEGRAKTRKLEGVEVHEFDGKIVTGLSGHIIQWDVPRAYKSWSVTNAYKLIAADLVVVPIKKEVVKALQQMASDADAITLATDYDREGELIGVEALNIIKKIKPDVRVDRMRYSAIIEKDIKESFARRSEVDYNLAASAEARQIIDLIWGASLTVFVSLSANHVGDDFFSVGRVQSPTLALLVEKEKEIANFVPRKFWELNAKLKTEKGEIFDVTHEKRKIWEREEAEGIKSRIESAKSGIVRLVKTKLRVDKPPAPFDTTGFISAASSIGYTPRRAMTIAQSLYLEGLISYHRTDNTTYPEMLDLEALVKIFQGHEEFGEHARELLKKKKLKPTAGKKKTTDHPPIHPVAETTKEKLDKDEWKVYELVVRRFLATLSDAAKWQDTEVKVEVEGERLEAKGKELKEQGFLAIYPYQKKEELILPKLKEGDKVIVEDLELANKETKPPNRISQAGLIKKMEDLGLGTKSTRHEIIGKLYDRLYVQSNPAKPTEKAFALINSLEKYAAVITKPEMTRMLEQEMDWISEGKRKKKEVVDDSRKILSGVFKEMMENREEIGKSLKEGIKNDKIVGTCPECGSELLLMRSKRGKRFVGCSNYPACNFPLPLPKSGRMIVTDDVCEKHLSFFKLKIVQRGKKPWDFGCPYCNFLEWERRDQKSEDYN